MGANVALSSVKESPYATIIEDAIGERGDPIMKIETIKKQEHHRDDNIISKRTFIPDTLSRYHTYLNSPNITRFKHMINPLFYRDFVIPVKYKDDPTLEPKKAEINHQKRHFPILSYNPTGRSRILERNPSMINLASLKAQNIIQRRQALYLAKQIRSNPKISMQNHPNFSPSQVNFFLNIDRIRQSSMRKRKISRKIVKRNRTEKRKLNTADDIYKKIASLRGQKKMKYDVAQDIHKHVSPVLKHLLRKKHDFIAALKQSQMINKNSRNKIIQISKKEVDSESHLNNADKDAKKTKYDVFSPDTLGNLQHPTMKSAQKSVTPNRSAMNDTTSINAQNPSYSAESKLKIHGNGLIQATSFMPPHEVQIHYEGKERHTPYTHILPGASIDKEKWSKDLHYSNMSAPNWMKDLKDKLEPMKTVEIAKKGPHCKGKKKSDVGTIVIVSTHLTVESCHSLA